MAGLSNIASAFGFFAVSQLLTGIGYTSYYACNIKYFEVLFQDEFNVFAIFNGVMVRLVCKKGIRFY